MHFSIKYSLKLRSVKIAPKFKAQLPNSVSAVRKINMIGNLLAFQY